MIYKEKPKEKDISELSACLDIGLALGSKVVEEEEEKQLANHLGKLLDAPIWRVNSLAAAKLAQALDDRVAPEQVRRLLDKLLALTDADNTARESFVAIARHT